MYTLRNKLESGQGSCIHLSKKKKKKKSELKLFEI